MEYTLDASGEYEAKPPFERAIDELAIEIPEIERNKAAIKVLGVYLVEQHSIPEQIFGDPTSTFILCASVAGIAQQTDRSRAPYMPTDPSLETYTLFMLREADPTTQTRNDTALRMRTLRKLEHKRLSQELSMLANDIFSASPIAPKQDDHPVEFMVVETAHPFDVEEITFEDMKTVWGADAATSQSLHLERLLRNNKALSRQLRCPDEDMPAAWIEYQQEGAVICISTPVAERLLERDEFWRFFSTDSFRYDDASLLRNLYVRSQDDYWPHAIKWLGGTLQDLRAESLAPSHIGKNVDLLDWAHDASYYLDLPIITHFSNPNSKARELLVWVAQKTNIRTALALAIQPSLNGVQSPSKHHQDALGYTEGLERMT